MSMIEFEMVAAAVTAAAIVFVIVSVRRDNRHNATQEVAIRQWMAQQHAPACSVPVCESCRRQPATVTVTVRDAPTFAVCRDCTPQHQDRPAVIVLPRAESGQLRLAATSEETGHDVPATH